MNTRSISDSARENKVTYDTANKIVNNFFATGNCEPRKGLNETGKKMQDWMMAYLEALVLMEPWLYLREIGERLTNHLTLQPYEVSGLLSIWKALATLELDRKSVTIVAQERFTPANLQQWHVYNIWKDTVNMSDVYFLDETGFHAKTDFRRMGRSFPNERIPLVTSKNFGVPKWSVLGAIGFNQELVHAVPLPCNYTRVFFNNVLDTHILPLLP